MTTSHNIKATNSQSMYDANKYKKVKMEFITKTRTKFLFCLNNSSYSIFIIPPPSPSSFTLLHLLLFLVNLIQFYCAIVIVEGRRKKRETIFLPFCSFSLKNRTKIDPNELRKKMSAKRVGKEENFNRKENKKFRCTTKDGLLFTRIQWKWK